MKIKNRIYLHENLKTFRLVRGENQSIIGDLVGKKYTAVSSWENGLSSPSLEDTVKIADHFGVYVGDFIGKKFGQGEVVMISDPKFEGDLSGEVVGDILIPVDEKDFDFFSIQGRILKFGKHRENYKNGVYKEASIDPEMLINELALIYMRISEVSKSKMQGGQ
jgi:transcriptional regulator with XRE-family HTH domain